MMERSNAQALFSERDSRSPLKILGAAIVVVVVLSAMVSARHSDTSGIHSRRCCHGIYWHEWRRKSLNS
jgi:hypothetical protein